MCDQAARRRISSGRPDRGGRTGAHIRWQQGDNTDKGVEQQIRALLGGGMTPEASVQIALFRNQNLQATYEELGVAQADLIQAGHLKNPTLSAEVRFPKYHALPFEFDVTQSIVDLILMPIRKRAAGAAFEAAKLRVTNEVLQTASEAKAAFFRAQGAEQLVEMRRSVVKATDASFEAARRLHDAGNINDLRLSNERAIHEQAKIDLAKAEAQALDAREELNAVMGLWGQETTWQIAPKLPELPATEVPEHGLESLGISRRADLGAAKADVVAAGQNLGLSRFNAIGDFTIGGHFEKDTGGESTAGPAIQIPIPIFNQGQAAVSAAVSRYRQSQHRYLALAVQVRAQVRRERNKLLSARDRAEYYRRVLLPLRHDIVQQTQLQFNGMFVSVFELLQAKQSEIDAGREYVQAVTDYWVARTELERAVGGSLRTSIPASSLDLSGNPSEISSAPNHDEPLQHGE